MNKYQRKSSVVEAVQFDPEAEHWPKGVRKIDHSNLDYVYYIQTPKGYEVPVSPGNWIVYMEHGSYCYTPEFFTENYDLVEENE